MDSLKELVKSLEKKGYLKNPDVKKAFLKVDRAKFVPADCLFYAYLDAPLPLGKGQTISQPLTVAFMLELLAAEKGNKVLDIGSGSGWTTSLLAEIVGEKGTVYAVERIRELKELGENNTQKAGYKNTVFLHGNGARGWQEHAPYDRILVSAAAPAVPEELKQQLKVGGRLVIPLRDTGGSMALVCRTGREAFKQKLFPGFSFVPLKED